jgi:HAD superfamily hydrolase (TIGR01509 family)
VFDCDGLLLDTELCWTDAEEVVFARYGKVFGAEDKRTLLGSSLPAAGILFERLLEMPGRADQLAAELLEEVTNVFSKGVEPLPGAVELVRALGGTVRLAVASNSPASLVDAALGGAGMRDAFDVVVAGDQVPSYKPAPDIYLRACELLDAPPSESVALEDSPPGVAAARAAGMYVIGVPSFPDLALEADLVAPSLSDPAINAVFGLGNTSN